MHGQTTLKFSCIYEPTRRLTFQERDSKNINQNHPSQTEQVTENSISNQIHFHYATLRCIRLQVPLILGQLKELRLPISVAARSKAGVCGRSPAGVAGSNPVCLCLVSAVCCKVEVSATVRSRGILPIVVCLSVISKRQQWGGHGPLGLPNHEKKKESLLLTSCTWHHAVRYVRTGVSRETAPSIVSAAPRVILT